MYYYLAFTTGEQLHYRHLLVFILATELHRQEAAFLHLFIMTSIIFLLLYSMHILHAWK